MLKLSAMLLCDFYKISHREQYPEGTERVYATWTPRGSRIKHIKEVVNFGAQAFIKNYLIDFFNEAFFDRSKEKVVAEYSRIIKHTLGIATPPTQHIEDLHDLGYLPLEIKALPEGTLVPMRVPMLTIENTNDKFFWLTNYIETLASAEMWKPVTSATLAYQYRKLLDTYASETGGPKDFVQFQGHDFSMRGSGSLQSAIASGAGHLLSFSGTDTIPAVMYLEQFYNADVEKELVGTSIPATEHSVMCAYGQDELASYKRIITEVYPTGPVSIVSDTWDLWKVLSHVIEPLKDVILARDGGPESLDKVVIRPDSGDPVKIVCGDPEAAFGSAEFRGVVECLWDIFEGTINEKGFKELDPHIGCIYGDAITFDRCAEICARLKAKGFASTNMVYGIGSYTYQYNTRDTFGFALKSTSVTINGDEKQIYKDPKTDDGLKKSQRGRVQVITDVGTLTCVDQLLSTDIEAAGNRLETVFLDGLLVKDQSLREIRERITNG